MWLCSYRQLVTYKPFVVARAGHFSALLSRQTQAIVFFLFWFDIKMNPSLSKSIGFPLWLSTNLATSGSLGSETSASIGSESKIWRKSKSCKIKKSVQTNRLNSVCHLRYFIWKRNTDVFPQLWKKNFYQIPSSCFFSRFFFTLLPQESFHLYFFFNATCLYFHFRYIEIVTSTFFDIHWMIICRANL